MLGCDNCDRWFHGSCMKIDTATGDALSNWLCPPCSEGNFAQAVNAETNRVEPDGDKNMLAQEYSTPIPQPHHHLDISPHAPNPISLWPPFGLRNSKEATEALGKVGDSDNEDFDSSIQSKTQPPLILSNQHNKPASAPVASVIMSKTSICQPVASVASSTVPSVSQSEVAITNVSNATSNYSLQSTVGTFEADRSQKSGIQNSQELLESQPPTQSTTIETTHSLSCTPPPSSTLPIVGVNLGQTIHTSSLGADLSVAVANLDAFVLAAGDTHRLPPDSTAANSLETGAAVEVGAPPP